MRVPRRAIVPLMSTKSLKQKTVFDYKLTRAIACIVNRVISKIRYKILTGCRLRVDQVQITRISKGVGWHNSLNLIQGTVKTRGPNTISNRLCYAQYLTGP